MRVNQKLNIDRYIYNFFSTRERYWLLFDDIRREYRNQPKPIQDSRITKVMTFVETVEGNLGKFWQYDSLVPQVFATNKELAESAISFSEYLERNSSSILRLYNIQEIPYFVLDLYNYSHELSVFLRDFAEKIIFDEPIPMPYIQLRQALLRHKTRDFVEKFNSILSGLSYNMRHNMTMEAYFHITTHLILKMLGIHIESEDETDMGRIDSSIELSTSIYIFEHKYAEDDSDRSMEALQQIIDKKYADKFKLAGKPIYCVGFSFGKTNHHIDYYREQQIS